MANFDICVELQISFLVRESTLMRPHTLMGAFFIFFDMKDAYYFPHDSNARTDPKIIIMINSIGLEGYGLFWIIIEMLRDQPDHKLPWDVIPGISSMYNITMDKVLALVRNYDLFEWEENSFFFSNSLINRMNPLKEKRAKLIEAGRLGGIASGASRRTKSKQTKHRFGTIEQKESKVKESKVKETERNFELFWNHYHEITLKEKTDKQPAFKKFKRLTLEDQREAYTGIQLYADWCKRKYGDKQFIKKARTYLEDRVWEDDLQIKKDPTKFYAE